MDNRMLCTVKGKGYTGGWMFVSITLGEGKLSSGYPLTSERLYDNLKEDYLFDLQEDNKTLIDTDGDQEYDFHEVLVPVLLLM